MKKSLLLKYIRRETTSPEEDDVLKWINKSPDNERYFIGLNNLWISQNISQDKASKEEVDEIKALTTNKKTSRFKYKKVTYYVAAAIILISAGLNFFLIKENSLLQHKINEPIQLAELPSAYKHELYTEKGVKAKIILPDSSYVWLNSGSKIIFPDRFERNIREIEFSGEAFFDVHKDSLRPLVIKTNKNFKVEVRGTKFNLKTYDNDKEARTTLYSGSLNVISEVKGKNIHSKEVITQLKPLETCIIRGYEKPVLLRPNNVNDHQAWKNGEIVFDSTPMEEVVKILERWHGINFEVKDKYVYNYNITAKFKSESIVQIMEMIKYCAPLDYSIDSTNVFLFKRKL